MSSAGVRINNLQMPRRHLEGVQVERDSEREREPKIKRPTDWRKRESSRQPKRDRKQTGVLCAPSQRTTVLLTRWRVCIADAAAAVSVSVHYVFSDTNSGTVRVWVPGPGPTHTHTHLLYLTYYHSTQSVPSSGYHTSATESSPTAILSHPVTFQSSPMLSWYSSSPFGCWNL